MRDWIASSADPEESGATPGCAGDGARDGRKACVGGITPHVAIINNGNHVSLAAIFPDENGANLEPPGAVHIGSFSASKAVQPLGYILIKSAMCLLLDMPADRPGNEVLLEGRWRWRSESGMPQRAELIEAERSNADDLGLQCMCTI